MSSVNEMLVVKLEFHSFILSRESTRERAGKEGHGDEEDEEDEEGGKDVGGAHRPAGVPPSSSLIKSCCKTGIFHSFRCQRHSSISEINTAEMCGSSQSVIKDDKELSWLTRALAANRKELESRRGSRLGPLMVPVWAER